MQDDKSKIIYGINTINELIKHKPEKISQLIINRDLSPRLNEIEILAKKNNIYLKRLVREKINEIAKNSRHQGVIAFIKSSDNLNKSNFFQIIAKLKKKILLILDNIEDPRNLGAILRTASFFGVGGIIISKHQSSPLTPTVHRVACGAVDLLPILQVNNISQIMVALKKEGFWLVGTDIDGDENLYKFKLKAPLALVIGSEEKGLRNLTKKKSDFLVRIPNIGPITTLNVSVAVGIFLSHLVVIN